MARRVGRTLTAVGLLGALLVGTPRVAGATPSLITFSPRTDYPVDLIPSAVAAADLNGDSVLDLVVANGASDTVSVLLGVGDGTFAQKTDYATGDAPIALALGDLDGDSDLDLVVGNGLGATMSVLLGGGDGTFVPLPDVPSGDNQVSVALGDLNGDSFLDVAAANGNDSTVSVFLGSGDGTFVPRTDYATPWPTSVAIGDLDGDAAPDLVVANGYSASVSVLLGQGDGSFTAGPVLVVGEGPQDVTLGDLDGDSIPDLVTANVSDATLSVLLGRGDGTFTRTTLPLQGMSPWTVELADLNGDSVLDLAVPGGDDEIAVLLGSGGGTYAAKLAFVTGAGPTDVAIGDLDDDGRPDLAVANSSSDTVSVLLNAGPASAPDAPAIGAATAGNSKATLSWTAPAADGGLPITGYVVTPFVGDVAQPSVTFTASPTTQTVTGLTNGVTYTFRVAATNAVGTGPQSSPSVPVTPLALPPAPTIIRNAIAGYTSATVSWIAPASDGGSPITGYVVTPNIGYFPLASQTFTSTATTQTISGLTNGTEYRFRVQAVNAAGTSGYSKATNPVTPAVMAPGAPTIIRIATAGDGQATVSWIAPTSDGGSPVTGYVVAPYIGYYPLPPQTFSSTATTQTVTGLTNGTEYRFRVQAVNAVGTGGFSAVTNPVTPTA